MQIDAVTLKDLSVFNGELNVFDLIDQTTSHLGSARLKQYLQKPPQTYESLMDIQDAVRYWQRHEAEWDSAISNGTLVMLKDFFESADGLHYKPSSWMFAIDAALQRMFNKNAYSLLQFSVFHLIDLVKGLKQILDIEDAEIPVLVQQARAVFEAFLGHKASRELLTLDRQSSLRALMHAGYHARRQLKKFMTTLFEQYAYMDCWHAMAKAGKQLGFTLPEISRDEQVALSAKGLFHPLLKQAVPYDIELGKDKHMLFLTGANMSGKSTLLRSLGLSALLAHIGMGVPAKEYRVSFLEGIITNMQVEDNIFKGESYFFAEVQRMKITAQKIRQSTRHLVLMDELFKGTNVHDAYECSKAVIQHLIPHKHDLLALSTHLYELYDELKEEPGIAFRYCNTNIDPAGNYSFTYELKEGVSNDKIGFLVLQHEGVLEILKPNT